MADRADKKRAARIMTRQDAVLVTSDLAELPVVIADVSVDGFRIEARETFYIGENILIGEEVTLRLPREGELRGRIRWAQGCEAGGVFLSSPEPN